MYKKTVTFEDFNGKEHTMDFYFHISEDELIKKEYVGEGGMDFSDFITEIIQAENKGALAETFEQFILLAYGTKSDDGMVFEKSPEATARFKNHAAFGQIYMELLQDEKEASAFVNGVFPRSMRTRLAEIEKKVGKSAEEFTAADLKELAETSKSESSESDNN